MKFLFLFIIPILLLSCSEVVQPEVPISIHSELSPKSVRIGDTLIIPLTVSGASPSFQWYKDDALISTDSTLIYPIDSLFDTGSFWCKVFNSNDTVYTDTITISLAEITIEANVIQNPYGNLFSSNDTVTLEFNVNAHNRMISALSFSQMIDTTFVYTPIVSIIDTIQFVIDRTDTLVITLIDNEEDIWIHKIELNVTSDTPEITWDTTIPEYITVLNDTLYLTPGVTDSFGKIIKYEWDIGGSGVFSERKEALSPPIVCNEMPTVEHCGNTPLFPIIFRATDDDFNSRSDTLLLKVKPNTQWRSIQSLPISKDDFGRIGYSRDSTFSYSELVQCTIPGTLPKRYGGGKLEVFQYKGNYWYWDVDYDRETGYIRLYSSSIPVGTGGILDLWKLEIEENAGDFGFQYAVLRDTLFVSASKESPTYFYNRELKKMELSSTFSFKQFSFSEYFNGQPKYVFTDTKAFLLVEEHFGSTMEHFNHTAYMFDNGIWKFVFSRGLVDAYIDVITVKNFIMQTDRGSLYSSEDFLTWKKIAEIQNMTLLYTTKGVYSQNKDNELFELVGWEEI